MEITNNLNDLLSMKASEGSTEANKVFNSLPRFTVAQFTRLAPNYAPVKLN